MNPFAIVSTGRKVAATGKSVLSRSQREEMLANFGIETTEHTLLMLDMFIAALLEHERERGNKPEWYLAITDDSLPTAARLEATSAMKATFLTLIRNAHDPILGNKMLATAVAGLAQASYPEDLKARVLGIVPQLVPADVDLLYRYCTEGVARTEMDANCEIIMFPRHLVQESLQLRFILDDGGLSEPLDSFSYGALKRHELVQDAVLGTPGPSRRPKYFPRGFAPPDHEAFHLEWRLTVFGVIIIEAFTGRPISDICPAPVAAPSSPP